MSRAEPLQERSRATVERILAAADAEIGEVGLARTSTRRIAQRAGVSVGATYRFFADKEAIAVALSERYLDAALTAYGAVLDEVSGPEDLPVAINTLVRNAALLQQAHPGYYRLTEERLPDLVASPAHVAREGIVDLLSTAMIRTGAVSPEIPEALVRTRIELCVETVRHALAHADSKDSTDRDLLIEELSHMLTAYLTR
ncbi:TetR/AcrR family transcriptional regulator [Nocardioides sp.]|uniref:TetR/AcrR family transcriptional regulator n=1 Tax=Nocardioides sp. TaxID=35761 RepID=UPI002B704CFC|nr:TetR/AcrR family transcriptional regulator [Nocardioides sp.]HXH80391.1 TetR/AcrR family transcriptional regulator [Nocardioides sp.]